MTWLGRFGLTRKGTAMETESTQGKRTVLITGASAGLGAAFARGYARRGMALVLTARRRDWIEALARELAGEHQTQSLIVPADLAATRACCPGDGGSATG